MDVHSLCLNPDVEELGYVFDAINLTRKEVDGQVPVIGFSGAPWTLMAYMIEGKGSKTYSKAKSWLFCHPKESLALLDDIANIIIRYLIGQIRAGAQVIQVCICLFFNVSPFSFIEFVLSLD